MGIGEVTGSQHAEIAKSLAFFGVVGMLADINALKEYGGADGTTFQLHRFAEADGTTTKLHIQNNN